MPSRSLLFLSALIPLSALAADIDISVRDKNGMCCAKPSDVALDVRRSRAADGAETYVCRLTSMKDEALMLRVEARVPVETGVTTLFDGRREWPLSTVRTNAFLIEAFPMAGVWGPKRKGMALATGAEAGDTYVDFVSSPHEMLISVRAALLHKGAVYETVFHRFTFDAKYGAMDAFARYYAFYPKRFKRDPNVDPMLNGINAQYSSWRKADPEPCRFMNATWDLCIGASRTWGDVNDREQPVGPRNTAYSWDEEIMYLDRRGKYHRFNNGEISQAQFDTILGERIRFGYFCGVRNSYYVMALANISNEIAKRHPDSVAVGHTFADNSYTYSTEVFPFPECSWGQDIRRQLKELSEKQDISAVYFDVARSRGIYRGKRLAEMKNVSWDEYGPGVARSVASAKLFEYVRTLPTKNSRYRMGVTLNCKYAHLNDIFYSDSSDSESCPWDEEKPFPLERRLASGEKGYELWEGYSTDEFDPNFKTWPEDEKNMLYNALAHFAIHSSFRTGASLPCAYMTEYTALMSHAFVRMNLAGWKPVPGACIDGEGWELARYGLGDLSYLAVNNLSNVVRKAVIEVYPAEIASGRAGGAFEGKGFLYAPFYGGKAWTRLSGGREGVSFHVGAQLSGVLEAVGSLMGEGSLSAEFAGDFETVRVRVGSRDFKGSVSFLDKIDDYERVGARTRELTPGEVVEVAYRNVELEGLLANVRALKGGESIRHGTAGNSRDQAERMAVFFSRATGKRPAVVADKTLGRLSVALGGVAVSAKERWELCRLVTRVLNAINSEKYPAYRPPIPMSENERSFYPFVRY